MTKDFSYDKYPSREIEEIPLHMEVTRDLMESVANWKLAALIFASIALIELISWKIIPYFFPWL